MPAPLLDRLHRLATLHNELATAHAENRRGLSTQELLQNLSCQRKALYKLVEELRELGAPVEYDDAEHLWAYRHTWNFPVQLIETLQGPVGVRLSLDFLLDPALERDLQGRIAIDPALKGAAGATLPRMTGLFSSALLGPLARALKERRVVRFAYQKPSEATGHEREVEPLELFEWDGMPYLQARDPKDRLAPFKRYALSRMEKLVVLDNTFRPPPKRHIPSCLGAFCGKVFQAVIVSDFEHAPYVRERKWHPSQTIKDRRDGGVEFTLPFGDTSEATRWILGRGPGFKPVAPIALVTAWRDALAKLVKN